MNDLIRTYKDPMLVLTLEVFDSFHGAIVLPCKEWMANSINNALIMYVRGLDNILTIDY